MFRKIGTGQFIVDSVQGQIRLIPWKRSCQGISAYRRPLDPGRAGEVIGQNIVGRDCAHHEFQLLKMLSASNHSNGDVDPSPPHTHTHMQTFIHFQRGTGLQVRVYIKIYAKIQIAKIYQ